MAGQGLRVRREAACKGLVYERHAYHDSNSKGEMS